LLAKEDSAAKGKEAVGRREVGGGKGWRRRCWIKIRIKMKLGLDGVR